MATHRGTPRSTNKALNTTQLMLGGDKSLMLINIFFWCYAGFGIGVGFELIICIVGFVICFMGLRFAAKADPRYVPAFKANSRFLVQKSYYPARGSVNFNFKLNKVSAIAFNKISKTPKGG